MIVKVEVLSDLPEPQVIIRNQDESVRTTGPLHPDLLRLVRDRSTVYFFADADERRQKIILHREAPEQEW